MKNLVLTIALTLPMIGFSLGVNASNLSKNLIAANIRSGAVPSNARVQNAIHFFEINVPTLGLSSLIIDIPKGIDIGGEIIVENHNGQPVNATVNMSDKKAIVTFSQPVASDSHLFVRLTNVRTRGYAKTWNYKLYGTMTDSNQEIPLGTRQVQTYD